VLVVIPAAIAFNYLWKGQYSHDLDPATAARPSPRSIRSRRTIPFAALTGVLWMSSLGAGWLESWTTYRRLPGDRAPPRRPGPRPQNAAHARFLAHNVSGFGGNASLGFLLGMTV
jgi:site-specific recombinase